MELCQPFAFKLIDQASTHQQSSNDLTTADRFGDTRWWFYIMAYNDVPDLGINTLENMAGGHSHCTALGSLARPPVIIFQPDHIFQLRGGDLKKSGVRYSRKAMPG